MAQTFERAKSRLNNIRAIEPLLGALRTLSMGTWQMALKKIARLQQYEKNYDHILIEILPKIEDKRLRKSKQVKKDVELADTIILIIGTERGLCGKFNKILANNAIHWIDEQSFPSHQIWAMGSRMTRELERMGVNISWRKPLLASELPSYQQSYLTTQTWLEQFERYQFNHFFVLFNQIAKGGGYQFSSFKLLPYAYQSPISIIEKTERRWPPAIIETDPKGIYLQIIEHYIASSFYQILLKSAAAEHASRYNLMQEAKDNAQDIIEELQQTLNNERKRKITQEMQELASGAGLLDN
jgi:F-type H+-transporting ATPase subunit gamma